MSEQRCGGSGWLKRPSYSSGYASTRDGIPCPGCPECNLGREPRPEIWMEIEDAITLAGLARMALDAVGALGDAKGTLLHQRYAATVLAFEDAIKRAIEAAKPQPDWQERVERWQATLSAEGIEINIRMDADERRN